MLQQAISMGALVFLLGASIGQISAAESGGKTEAAAILLPEPLPSAEARQKAKRLLDEVFGEQVARAKLPQEKAKLAKEMLDLALEAPDGANRYVLAQEAKRLALDGQETRLVMQAVEILAGFSRPEGNPSASEAARLGHAAWAASEKLSGKTRLQRQAEAAEWYLRAIEGELPELEYRIIRKRLAEMGWQAYLRPQKVVSMFRIPNAKIKGETITWLDEKEWLVAPVNIRPPLEFGFDMKAAKNHVIRVLIGDHGYALVCGADGKQETWQHSDFVGPYHPQMIAPLGVDQNWHTWRMVITKQAVQVYCDNKLLDTIQPPSFQEQTPIKVGFGDHRTETSIRRVFIRPLEDEKGLR